MEQLHHVIQLICTIVGMLFVVLSNSYVGRNNRCLSHIEEYLNYIKHYDCRQIEFECGVTLCFFLSFFFLMLALPSIRMHAQVPWGELKEPILK